MVLDGNAVRSVDRAAALLLALGESQGEAGVTELARRLGLQDAGHGAGQERIGWPNAPSAPSTCEASPCPSWNGWPA